MKLLGFTILSAAFLVSASTSYAQQATPLPQVGDTFIITRTLNTEQKGSDSSTGSSHDRDTLVERVVRVRTDGLELEYDLPKSAPLEERASNWQFPAKVFRSTNGLLELLNAAELEARVDAWLKRGKMSRAVCGKWIFTWNAFRIECEPTSVLKIIDSFALAVTDVREGAAYSESGALGVGTLTRQAAGIGSRTLVAQLQVDPDAIRRAQAQSDVAVGEIMNKPTSLEAAMREHSRETISGTIVVTFEVDLAGNLVRRTKITNVQLKKPDGRSSMNTATEILERNRLPHTPK